MRDLPNVYRYNVNVHVIIKWKYEVNEIVSSIANTFVNGFSESLKKEVRFLKLEHSPGTTDRTNRFRLHWISRKIFKSSKDFLPDNTNITLFAQWLGFFFNKPPFADKQNALSLVRMCVNTSCFPLLFIREQTEPQCCLGMIMKF